MSVRQGSTLIASSGGGLPAQSGKSGKYLTTDGSNAYWDDIEKLSSNNAGSNITITEGQNSLPAEYQEVTYLEATGTQYIDTGLISTTTTDFELAGTLTSSTCVGVYLGADSTDSQRSGIFQDGTGITLWQGNYGKGIGSSVGATFTYSVIGSTVYSNGSDRGTITRIAGIVNLILFASQTYNNVIDNYLTGRIKYCKIWVDNVLMRNYIPCYRISDNIAGMYDTVNGAFYASQGTGAFIAGEKDTSVKKINAVTIDDNSSTSKTMGWSASKLTSVLGDIETLLSGI